MKNRDCLEVVPNIKDERPCYELSYELRTRCRYRNDNFEKLLAQQERSSDPKFTSLGVAGIYIADYFSLLLDTQIAMYLTFGCKRLEPLLSYSRIMFVLSYLLN
jgi:hypothetical protein